MTVFNEQKKADDQGTWCKFQTSHFDKDKKEFVFDDPEEGAAEFCFRSMIPYFVEKMKSRKRKFEFVLNPSTRAMERVSYYPDLTAEEQQKETDDAADYAITGMQNAFWGKDKPIECTRENKLKLMKDEQFDRFFGRYIKLIAELEASGAEATEKN
jgi:hypothetical protein